MTTAADIPFEPCDVAAMKRGLASPLYFDAQAYTADLQQVWSRQWIYACRHDALARIGDYRVVRIGTQSILIVRDTKSSLRAFHNTCPHRGSILRDDDAGHLPGRIVCPYHRWTYALTGDLISVPFLDTGGSEKCVTLYAVALHEWGGNVFVNLAGAGAPAFETCADPGLEVLAHWPLAELRVVHTHEYYLACNWKVFWENFVECYHCPGTHPGLCRLVPIYQHTYTEVNARLAAAGLSVGVAEGMESWTTDGKAHGPVFPGLSAEERRIGYTFLMFLPTLFMVAHQDYVRQVSILPLGPELCAVKCEWLCGAEAIQAPDFNPAPAIAFVTQLLAEDAQVCELNQRGLRAIPHVQGRLAPQEQEVFRFHQWYRARMHP